MISLSVVFSLFFINFSKADLSSQTTELNSSIKKVQLEGLRITAEIRKFLIGLTPAELDEIARPHSDSIRRKMSPPFAMAQEGSLVTCAKSEFEQAAKSVPFETAVYAQKIIYLVALEEDLRTIQYLKNIESFALRKKNFKAVEQAKVVLLGLISQKDNLTKSIDFNLSNSPDVLKNKNVRQKLAQLAPNCFGILTEENIERTHFFNNQLIGKYLVTILENDQKLKKEVAVQRNCSVIPKDSRLQWLSYFWSSENLIWKDSWRHPINCSVEEGKILIRSFGKSGLEKDAFVIGSINI